MIPIKDNIQKFGTDPILEDQIRIYETKKSILDRPSVKSPEEGQREFGRNVVKRRNNTKTTKMRGKSPQ